MTEEIDEDSVYIREFYENYTRAETYGRKGISAQEGADGLGCRVICLDE